MNPHIMNPHMTRDAYDSLTQKLSVIDAEIRSIRATLFQLAEDQHRASGNGESPQYRTAEDFIRQPD